MKNEEDELEKMVLVALEYYEKNKSQAEIAKELGLSRPTISRLLNNARKEKIVKIEIIDPNRLNEEAAEQVTKKLGIQGAVVISGHSPSPSLIRRNIAYAAANFINSMLDSGDIIGCGWGRTIKDLADYLKPGAARDLLFVPLLGGVGQVDSAYQSQTVIQTMADNCHAKWFQLHVPAILPVKNIKTDLLELPEVKNVVNYWQRMNMAIVGIGVSPLEDQFLFYDYVGDLERIHLSKKGAAGDICLRFFDSAGNQIGYEGQECISIDLETLKKTPKIIGIAGGKEKVRAILGACRAKFITHLVTDEFTAMELLNSEIGSEE